MTGKALCFWVRCAIIAIAVCGLCVCVVWYPIITELNVPLNVEKMQFWAQLVFYWLASLPCFWILIMGWRVTKAIKEDRLFTNETAKIVKTATQILFIDIAVFFIGNLALLLLKWAWWGIAIIHLFFLIAGLVVGIFMAILSHYLYKAAELQEESEGTI